MIEYPKVIVVDGINITARDADDEARWRTKPEPPPVVTPEPVAELVPDAPVASAPKKPKAKKPK